MRVPRTAGSPAPPILGLLSGDTQKIVKRPTSRRAPRLMRSPKMQREVPAANARPLDSVLARRPSSRRAASTSEWLWLPTNAHRGRCRSARTDQQRQGTATATSCGVEAAAQKAAGSLFDAAATDEAVVNSIRANAPAGVCHQRAHNLRLNDLLLQIRVQRSYLSSKCFVFCS